MMWIRWMGSVVLSVGCGVTVIPIDETDTDPSTGTSPSSSSTTMMSTSSSGTTTTDPTTSTESSSSEDSGSSSGSSSSEGSSSSDDSGTSSSSESGSSAGSSSSSGSTSTGAECEPADECIIDDDCPLPGATCIACLCVGGIGCDEYGEGEWADCLNDGNEACLGSDDLLCVVDAAASPQLGACSEVCDDVCDCPLPPVGFEAQLICEDLTGSGSTCFISCEGGQACPDGWTCFFDLICLVGELVVLDHYGDCENLAGDCPEGDVGSPICLGVPDDGLSGEGGMCTIIGCSDAGDCAAAPPTGDAVVACIDLTGEAGGDCYLDCSGGETCPDGMACHADLGICYFPAA